MRRGKRREFFRIAPEQHRLRHEAVAVPQREPALMADRQHRADQVLVGVKASGDAVDRDAKRSVAIMKRLSFRPDDAVRRGGA